MRIGPYQLDNNLLVAPMAGVTDRPFRQLCRRLGAGMAVSEMISSNAALRGSRKTVRRLDFAGEPGPIAVQILGADPVAMAEAARVNVAHGAQIIDINMGCPAKKVCKVAAGSALLMDPPLVGRILDAVVRAVEVPVTLKIRTGWDPQHRNGVEIARIAEGSGVQALAVHGRTRACGFSGQAEYDTIRSIKQAVSIPVIANGDIDSPEKAKKVLEQTGADAIMIGRAAQGRPWIFREITHYLENGVTLAPPEPGWIRDILLQHLENLYQFYGEFQGVRIARKHIAWYSKTQPGGALFRQRVNTTDSTEKQQALVMEFFDQLAINNKERAA
ncbi:tRNA dihydrouridine synthase DusB [Sedimenticola thiotaurini]|uniref:tRNA-dihydrouridine synthase B n=1 Tax=Sedimenticola thiotaurini TaxID=1543721 RepID=A0A0F7K312_9GAMM|nr:tRNA dihydrouridine synthase DusB [Sedimenticola thiotaurini]AKH21323.1 tRNA-dihydrouridine synthase B [Sedimenticola thiotaurini]